MKAILLSVILLALPVSMPAIVQGIESQVNGTWSGNWSPKGGVPDAVTVELQLNAGKLTGKFRTPATMEFTKASFDSKTHTVAAEASDPKSGKHFKLAGKIEGMELKGTLDANETTGEIRLIKWTFFGR